MNDPRVRKDSTCAHCHGPRKFAGLKLLYREQAELDPFCSAVCCRTWRAERRAKEAVA